MEMSLYNLKMSRLPFLFVTLNVLNVFDKAITWFALKNPAITELNPGAWYFIQKFGVAAAMAIYMLLGFVLFYVTYKVLIAKRLWCEKNNMPPETFFLMLNVIFCLIVINNIFWMLYR